MGGVDMVQFFADFKLQDGTYNEAEVGQQGSDEYSVSLNNYTYNFVTESNLRLVTFSLIIYDFFVFPTMHRTTTHPKFSAMTATLAFKSKNLFFW